MSFALAKLYLKKSNDKLKCDLLIRCGGDHSRLNNPPDNGICFALCLLFVAVVVVVVVATVLVVVAVAAAVD